MTEHDKAIRAFAKSIADIDDQIDELKTDRKQYTQSAKDQGIDVALLNRTVRIMRMESEKRAKALAAHEQFDLFLSAVGLIGDPVESAAKDFIQTVKDAGASCTIAAGDVTAHIGRTP